MSIPHSKTMSATKANAVISMIHFVFALIWRITITDYSSTEILSTFLT